MLKVSRFFVGCNVPIVPKYSARVKLVKTGLKYVFFLSN